MSNSDFQTGKIAGKLELMLEDLEQQRERADGVRFNNGSYIVGVITGFLAGLLVGLLVGMVVVGLLI